MSFDCKRVAVIGAGISGVVAAAHLKREDIEVTVFERSSAAGGIWYAIQHPHAYNETNGIIGFTTRESLWNHHTRE
jgi:cation diffusion facilitator CzcD-associated flavoprotein CzcO